MSRSAENRSPDLSSLFEPYVWAWFQDTFGQPSAPQVASWPRISEGRNTLILSPTGSGKTLAAFLWCINELFRMGSRQKLRDGTYVLYISPLKALNNDIQRNLVNPLKGIKRYAQKTGIDVATMKSESKTGMVTRSMCSTSLVLLFTEICVIWQSIG
jgi:ATP-dependent Lhr-like helicase